ncbi:MAG: histidine kinase [Brachybacterium sp.]|nr:histidine kinase [Brachybacterium sp.]
MTSDQATVAEAPRTDLAGTGHPETGRPGIGRPGSILGAVALVLTCLLLGALIWTVTFGGVLIEYDDAPPGPLLAMLLADLLLGLVAVGLVVPLRRRGRANLVLAPLLGFSAFGSPAALVALVRIGARRDLAAEIAAMLLVLLGGAVQMAVWVSVSGWSVDETWQLALVPILTFAILMWGRVRGTRAALLDSLREQADTAQRERRAVQREKEAAERERAATVREAAALRAEQDAAIARTRADERTAIARDMHDSLSHHLSLIAMYAGALAYREDLPPDQVRSTAATLRDAAGTASAELREVLVTLRSSTGADSAEPLPTLSTVDELIAQARAEGMRIELHRDRAVEEALQQAPRSTVVALQRMLGELVANARRHAPDAPLTLIFERRGEDLILLARNPVAAPVSAAGGRGTGFGLVGVQERARLVGGEAVARTAAGIEDDGDVFEVEVRIPWKR